MTEITAIRSELEKKLKPGRFTHTLGVMYTASSLAMCYGENIEYALLAGLLHDCGKFCSVKEQLELCGEYNLILTESQKRMPALIHARLGAYLAEHEYHIKIPEVLSAITFHTTGKPKMTMLEKIVYISDYIEPGREAIPGLDEVRKAAFTDIDEAVVLSAGATVSYLENAGAAIDPMTVRTYEYYQAMKKPIGVHNVDKS